MKRVSFVLPAALLILSITGLPRFGLQGSAGAELEKDNPWAILFAEEPVETLWEKQEREMTTASLVMGIFALLAVVLALLLLQRVRKTVTLVGAGVLTREEKERLTAVREEMTLLQTRVDQLDDAFRAKLEELKATAQQLDRRLTQVEADCRGLGAMAQDLDDLKDFRERIEQVHARVQQAFNGTLSKTPPVRRVVRSNVLERDDS
jgi:methyl-accepting chemotaxis protein